MKYLILLNETKIDKYTCPICGEPGGCAKCSPYECHCKNGHYWHVCPVHDVIVIGKAPKNLKYHPTGRHTEGEECSCPKPTTEGAIGEDPYINKAGKPAQLEKTIPTDLPEFHAKLRIPKHGDI